MCVSSCLTLCALWVVCYCQSVYAHATGTQTGHHNKPRAVCRNGSSERARGYTDGAAHTTVNNF